MNTRDAKDEIARLDQATADRLARLRSMPVDTSRLEKSLRAHIPEDVRVSDGCSTPSWRVAWFRPFRAVAASFLLLSAVVAVVLLSSSSRPALASPVQMAQMHEELLSGRTPVMQVNSIDEANKALGGAWPGAPTLPGAPEGHVMACCLKSVQGKKVACVLLRDGEEPVTMTVANAADMRLPKSPTVRRGSVTYHAQSSGDVNMVMTERNGRWVCLIGRVPAERLMDVSSKLEF
jgi:hypothetical protein